MKYLKGVRFELLFWVSALILLAFTNPYEHHFTLCPLANLGLDWCPGCGLGRAISHILHGNFTESFKMHWLGFPALMLIGYRIYSLIKYKTDNKIITI